MNYLKFCGLLCAALLFLTVNVRADNELSVVADALPHETNRILSQVKDWGPDSLAEGRVALRGKCFLFYNVSRKVCLTIQSDTFMIYAFKM